MDFAGVAIRNRVVTLVLTFVMLAGGMNAYNGMSRLEDPEFTIKDALVMTPYPGASAAEVEEEVTDTLEIAIQQMGQLDKIVSKSDRGLSTLTVSIKKSYDKATLPQVWDELRRKVNDAARDLPPGAGPSLVIDDYGDVFGVFVAITGDGYSYAELKDYVDFLKRELLLGPGCRQDFNVWRAGRSRLRGIRQRPDVSTRHPLGRHRGRTASEECRCGFGKSQSWLGIHHARTHR